MCVSDCAVFLSVRSFACVCCMCVCVYVCILSCIVCVCRRPPTMCVCVCVYNILSSHEGVRESSFKMRIRVCKVCVPMRTLTVKFIRSNIIFVNFRYEIIKINKGLLQTVLFSRKRERSNRARVGVSWRRGGVMFTSAGGGRCDDKRHLVRVPRQPRSTKHVASVANNSCAHGTPMVATLYSNIARLAVSMVSPLRRTWPASE